MSGFRDIVGHEEIIAHMQGAIRTGRISHAYILDGEPLSGKKTLAEAFAMALLCEGGEDACGTCASCRKVRGHNHPDLLYVQHEKPDTITVGEIRRQLTGSAAIKPYSSRYKIYIVDEAHKMNVQAQNALLKTLEEPPSYVVILLLTANAQSLLPTVRSRCVTLRLRAIPDDKIQKLLMERFHVPDYKAAQCAAFAMGNAGRAADLAASGEFEELKRILTGQMQRIARTRDSELAGLAGELSDYGDYTDEYLDMLLFWFRDTAVCKYTNGGVRLLYAKEEKTLRMQAAALDDAGLSGIFTHIEDARRRLRANGNRELVLTLLYLDIREALAS